MPPRPRPLTQHDRDEWATYVRHVRALAGRQVPPPPKPAPQANISQPGNPQPSNLRSSPMPAKLFRQPPAFLTTGLQPAGLDNSTWSRFRGGKLPAVRTLDLHGKTAQAAFHALERFLLAAHADQIRCVEIITGRGTGESGGVIRRELPLWLNLPRLRPLVLATAHPHAQNTGSTRLLLRRIR
jgi:DNA-nicking Smr family endonuclease